jgi:hypothetical protein
MERAVIATHWLLSFQRKTFPRDCEIVYRYNSYGSKVGWRLHKAKQSGLSRSDLVHTCCWCHPSHLDTYQSHFFPYKQVEVFLRGPDSSYNLTGCFTGIADARKALARLTTPAGMYQYRSSYSRRDEGSLSDNSCSFNAWALGTGRNARVQIRKTEAWFQGSVVKGKEPLLQELRAVRAMRQP